MTTDKAVEKSLDNAFEKALEKEAIEKKALDTGRIRVMSVI